MPWTEEDDAKFAAMTGGSSKKNEAYWRNRLKGQGEIKTAPPRSAWRRFFDNLENTMRNYGPANIIARNVAPLIETGDGSTREERRAKINQMVRQRRENFAAVDPADSVGDHVVDFAGGLAGSALSDPTNFIGGFGKNLGERVVNMMGTNAAIDVGLQGIDVAQGVQDEYDPVQGAVSVAVPPAIVGASQAAKKAYRVIRPVVGKVTSGFGRRKAPKAGASTDHGGIDIAAPEGTVVQAPGAGVVSKVGRGHSKRGNWVEIDHGNGLTSRYLHLAGFRVKPGDKLEPGQLFGRVGKTGNVTGPHLHWSVLKDGKPVDPTSVDFDLATDVRRPAHPMSPEEIARIVKDQEAGVQGRITPEEQRILDEADDSNVDFEQKPLIYDERRGDWRDESELEAFKRRRDEQEFQRQAEELRRNGPHIIDDPRVDEVLTSAERQEMDASVTGRPPAENTGYEKFTPYIDGPKKPANEDIKLQLKPEEYEPAIDIARLMAAGSENNISKYADADVFMIDLMYKGKKSTGNLTISKDGTAVIDLNHAEDGSKLALGPAEVRRLAKQIKEQFPHITTFAGDRITGARQNLETYGSYVEVKLPGEKKTSKVSLGEFLKQLWRDESGSFNPFGRKGYRDGPEGPDESPNPTNKPVPVAVQKLKEALQEARPIRSAQERAYATERGKRLEKVQEKQKYTSGEAGFYAELGELQGALPKVDFESIRDKFDQRDIDELFDLVKNDPTLTLFDQINARKGLLRLLGAEGGAVPANHQLKILARVFPKDVIDALMKNRPFAEKFWDNVIDVAGVPRTVMSSYDLSAPLRQGAPLMHRKEYWKSFVQMFRLFGNEKAFKELEAEIRSRPTYKLMQKAGLAITDTGRFADDREEAFISKTASRLPGIKHSNNAYTGFLIKLRADVFDSLVKQAADLGISFESNPKALRDIARYINNASGRGDLGKLNQAAPVAAALFFSPRLMASRLNLLNPAWYVTLDPFARKQAIKSMMTYAGLASTVLGLAAFAGADVETDPRSADFAKIKIGNTRYDILAGFQQYIRLGAQLTTGEKKTSSGEIQTLGERYGSDTRLDVLGKFLTNKFSPVASFFTDMLRGKNAIGEDFEATTALRDRFIPMFAQDLMEAMEEHGIVVGGIMGFPGMFGVSVQTYEPPAPKEKKKKVDEFGFSTDEVADLDKELGFEPKRKQSLDEEFGF